MPRSQETRTNRPLGATLVSPQELTPSRPGSSPGLMWLLVLDPQAVRSR